MTLRELLDAATEFAPGYSVTSDGRIFSSRPAGHAYECERRPSVVSKRSGNIDITFGDDGSMTIWLPTPKGEHAEFNVKGRVDPYDILDLKGLIGESFVIRILDPNGEEVSA